MANYDRRTSSRTDVKWPVRIHLDGRCVAGESVNLSLTDILVVSRAQVALNQRVIVQIEVEPASWISGQAVVKRIDPGPLNSFSVALQIYMFGAGDREVLRQKLRDLRNAGKMAAAELEPMQRAA